MPRELPSVRGPREDLSGAGSALQGGGGLSGIPPADDAEYRARLTNIFGSPAFYSDSTRRVVSPEIRYNEKTNRVSTRGSSEIVDGSLKLRALQLDFDDQTGLGTALGQVEWRGDLEVERLDAPDRGKGSRTAAE